MISENGNVLHLQRFRRPTPGKSHLDVALALAETLRNYGYVDAARNAIDIVFDIGLGETRGLVASFDWRHEGCSGGKPIKSGKLGLVMKMKYFEQPPRKGKRR